MGSQQLNEERLPFRKFEQENSSRFEALFDNLELWVNNILVCSGTS